VCGDERTAFPVHKETICTRSTFFEGAFNGGFKEALTQVMVLDDVTPHLFGLLNHWLYTNKVRIETPDHDVLLWGEGQDGLYITSLLKLWTLAQRFLIGHLQNDVMKLLFDAIMSPECNMDDFEKFAWDAYKSDENETALKLLAVDKTIWGMETGDLRKSLNRFPPLMFSDITLNLLKKFDQLGAAQKRGGPTLERYEVDCIN
jgi:hypothetical protein